MVPWRRSYLTEKELPGTGQSSNDQAEFEHLLNIRSQMQKQENLKLPLEKKRRRRKPTQTPEEQKKKKNERDRADRKRKRDAFNRLMTIASNCGGIDKMECDVQRLERIKSNYGNFEEIISKLNKLDQMKEELAVFEKVKTMFGGIEYILPGLDRLKKTEFQHPVSKPNKTERPFNDFLPPSPDFFQDGAQSLNSNNQGSAGDCDWLGDYGISQMFLAVETLYSDVLVTEFIAKLEKNSRSKVSFSSFKDLDGERQRVGDYSFPMSLVSTANAIMDAHGDVTKNSHFSPVVVENIYVFFCAAIKEMGDLSLKQVTEDTMLKWRDAIMDAKRSGCDVEFAWKHLETIAYAYFGLKARNYRISLEKKMANLMAEEKSLRQQLEKKEEEVKAVKGKEEELTSLQCKMCQDCVDRFLDKNVGLFG